MAVVEDVVDLTAPPVAVNVSNIAVDGITYYVTRKVKLGEEAATIHSSGSCVSGRCATQVSWMVVQAVGPRIATTISDGVFPGLRDKLNRTLVPCIREKIDKGVPLVSQAF
jgi:hypothetical protein